MFLVNDLPKISFKIEAAIMACTLVVYTITVFNLVLIQPETNYRLPHYLDPNKTFIQKIFDVRYTESIIYTDAIKYTQAVSYQSRELSYVCDILDCEFIRACFKLGYPHYTSLTYLAGIWLIVMLNFVFCRKRLNIDFLPTFLITLMFLSSACISFSGFFFRTGKIGASAVLYILMIFMFDLKSSGHFAAIAGPRRLSQIWKHLLIAFGLIVLGLSASLFDKQGFFVVCLILMISAAVYYIQDDSRYLFASGYLFVAVVIYIIWNQYVSLAITHEIFGYIPSAAFQNTWPIRDVVALSSLKQAALLFFDNFRLLSGNLNVVQGAIIYFLVCYVLYRAMRNNLAGRKRFVLINLFVVGNLCLIIMLAIMYTRHPAIIWADVRLNYYWLVLHVVFLFLITIACSELSKLDLYYSRKILSVFLLSAVLSNLYYYQAHRSVAMSGHLRGSYLYAGRMMAALKKSYDKDTGRYLLDEKVLSNNPALLLLACHKYGSARDLTPEDIVSLSRLCYRVGDFKGSIRAAEDALRLQPDYAPAYDSICAAWNALGEWDKAVAAGERAVALDPDNNLAKDNLALARSRGKTRR